MNLKIAILSLLFSLPAFSQTAPIIEAPVKNQSTDVSRMTTAEIFQTLEGLDCIEYYEIDIYLARVDLLNIHAKGPAKEHSSYADACAESILKSLPGSSLRYRPNYNTISLVIGDYYQNLLPSDDTKPAPHIDTLSNEEIKKVVESLDCAGPGTFEAVSRLFGFLTAREYDEKACKEKLLKILPGSRFYTSEGVNFTDSTPLH